MTAQGELDEKTVVYAGAEHERDRHQVHQIPRPAGQRHRGQQAQAAQGQHREAEQDFPGAAKRQPERKEHQRHHRRNHLPDPRFHPLQKPRCPANPSRKAMRRFWPVQRSNPSPTRD